MKKVFVANLREGARIEDVFLVAAKSVASTRAGSPFLRVKLADKTGEIDAIKWEISESEVSRLREDDYVLVHGSVRTYNDSLQVCVDSFTRYGEPVDPADFIASSGRDPKEMMSEFRTLIERVSDPHLRGLLDSFFEDEEFARKFQQAPAAARNHHAYVGGLLEHTINVLKTCAALIDLYPQANRDLVITGAALHDVGKVDEFVWSGSIKYSEEGNLIGHVVGGAMMVRQAIGAMDGFDPMMALTLQHMILAHHGRLEHGSPKLPQCFEALLLHHADDLDAQVSMFEKAIQESDEAGSGGLFTKRHHLLDRPIFKGLERAAALNGSDGGDGEVDFELFAVDSDSDPFAD